MQVRRRDLAFRGSLTSAIAVLLLGPVEQPPLMPAGVAGEPQHTDSGTLHIASGFMTLRTDESSALRR